MIVILLQHKKQFLLEEYKGDLGANYKNEIVKNISCDIIEDNHTRGWDEIGHVIILIRVIKLRLCLFTLQTWSDNT